LCCKHKCYALLQHMYLLSWAFEHMAAHIKMPGMLKVATQAACISPDAHSPLSLISELHCTGRPPVMLLLPSHLRESTRAACSFSQKWPAGLCRFVRL
jgi:hypothetical protein